ncbi:hypothetical protein [Haladaptatus sp. CMSO5]|uniref:hypothetical protein n=1 Tax=Haladaptatus sp. CMSO5 TaxID=3120514 RepID=UPI002FCDEC47
MHVKDVAKAYVLSAEKLLEALDANETGVSKFDLAGKEDSSVAKVASLVQQHATAILGDEPPRRLLENPRTETLVERFDVDTSRTTAVLGWQPDYSVEDAIRDGLSRNDSQEIRTSL